MDPNVTKRTRQITGTLTPLWTATLAITGIFAFMMIFADELVAK